MKIFNFSAGPAMLPHDVLVKTKDELLDWEDQGASVMEVSHRGAAFIALADKSISDLRKLYNVPDNYKILFAQGGARGQFAAIPMNLLAKDKKALYLTSGAWSGYAAKEARIFGEIDELDIISEKNNKVIVKNLDFTDFACDYSYVHYCPNETISGVEINELPQVGDTPLIADMSSCILSKKIDISRFAMIYAGAQKNLGASGITLIIIREDLLENINKKVPGVWNYKTLFETDSMFNTPPTFAWYLCAKVFEHWLNLGGLDYIEQHNKVKAAALYEYIDSSNLYKNNVARANRSIMNVTFSTNNEELDKLFISQANQAGLKALKGHRVLGGMRASIYNAMPLEGVETLIAFMRKFEAEQTV